MRILMVTPYPPVRDGIAAYAVQAVAALRRAGHDVEVLSPGPSAAHHHLDLVGPRGALALAKRVRSYDKLIVQFHPDFFYPVPSTALQRAEVNVALATAFRLARDVEVRVHEIDYRLGRAIGPDAVSARLLWRSADRIVVHTEREGQEFSDAFGVPVTRIHVADHGEDFARRTRFDREGARRSLGLDKDDFVFLSIGFIQPHKGFDRALRAFAGLGTRGCSFHVVGSVRVEDPHYLRHLDELESLAASTTGAQLHIGYVSDELFDRWIVASDVVVLPYRSIWSSGVLERAELYDKPVIATAVGGLPEQAGNRPDVTLVTNDRDLRAAVWAAAGERAAGDGIREPWTIDGENMREQIQQQVRNRAAIHRAPRSVRASTDGLAPSGGSTAASAPVRRLPPLQLPPATSSRPGAGLAKRLVRRLTAWEVEPLVWQVNALRNAVAQSLDGVASPGAAPGGRQGGGLDPADKGSPAGTNNSLTAGPDSQLRST